MAYPSGTLSLARNYLHLTIADATAFRTWTGAVDQSQALARIHDRGLPDPGDNRNVHTLAELQGYRPFVIVGDSRFASEPDAVGTSTEYSDSGDFEVFFEQDVSPSIADDADAVEQAFSDAIGGILDDMKGLAGQPGYLDLRINWDGEVIRSKRNAETNIGDAIRTSEILISWGSQ